MNLTDFRAGARAMLPGLVGVAPFGLVIGVAAAQAEHLTLAGWLTAPAIYGASAQIATIGMLDAGAAGAAVIATVLVINLRLLLYSAAIARYWRGTPLWWRLFAAYLLIDPSFVVGTAGYARHADRRRGHAHYLGGALLLWVGWLVAVAIGAVLGTGVPGWLHLELLVPLYLIGEVVPALREPGTRWAVGAAAVAAVPGLFLPLHLGIVVATVAGLGTAAAVVRSPAQRAQVTKVTQVNQVTEPTRPEPVTLTGTSSTREG
jgi:predicted branched-subunit amino acid permease